MSTFHEMWEVDPAGEQPARRLTRSAKAEGGAVFTPGGDVLFTSARPDPERSEQAPDSPAARIAGEGGGPGVDPPGRMAPAGGGSG